jgi:hypothetical protein
MIAIHEIVDIPASRRISFTLPETVPIGAASVTVSVDSAAAKKDPREIAREMWDSLPTLEECKQKAAAQYAEWKDSGVDPLEKFRGSGIFGHIDGVTYQRSIRDEWPDYD